MQPGISITLQEINCLREKRKSLCDKIQVSVTSSILRCMTGFTFLNSLRTSHSCTQLCKHSQPSMHLFMQSSTHLLCTLPCILHTLPQQLQSLRDQLKAKACEVCKENEILNQEFEELRCENKCLKCKIKELEEEGGCLKAIADNIRQKVGGGGLDPSESSRVSPGLGSISGNSIKVQMPCLILK